MKIIDMEHYDTFYNDEYVCWVTVGDVPNRFIEEAKEIDKENFSESCFGICVGYDEKEWYISQDSPECELYYIDNEGNKHWMEYVLNDLEAEYAIKFCQLYVRSVK